MASPTVTYSTITTVVAITDYGNGKYEVKEVPADEASFPGLHSGNRKEISIQLPFQLGVRPSTMCNKLLTVVGYYDIDDKEIGLYTTLGGSKIGSSYTGGIDSGVNLGIDLWVASGSYGVYKKGNELKFRFNLSAGISPFKTNYGDEYTLFNI
ncbi:uncharacterized protein KY384_000936 [Bacidia gigantensis]|uniref:uncharacterized protein n=1 Tax=Bacidia gigantensis TaxID=2732470 RepID=UPI001D054F4D|nr:uncharacterized protein KY384_000936 [Bacidia gigantensis]KAG8534093.1 hypothetical protein KY384_000936 [Bacidia gigantensis]